MSDKRPRNRLNLILFLVASGILVIAFWAPDFRQSDREKTTPKAKNQITRDARNSLELQTEFRKRLNRESMDSIRQKLLAVSAEEAVAEIEGFLATGEDKVTGIDFEIGSGGMLKGSPTLRVLLLNLLLEINPAAAARIGREILKEATTADEWAVALRNVARGEAESANNDYLRGKAEELITNPEWRKNPSIGFLNAFDILVYTGATESSALLSDLIKNKDRPDLAHAGFLTLDRLVQQKPVEMLTRLTADRALQESRPEMTAQQFARADLRDEEQRAIVKSWMLDPARTATELRNFASTYPNNNKMISNNLLTTSEESVSGVDLNAHDRQVLKIVREWRTDPSFESRSEYLESMEFRISQFIRSADHSR